MIKNSNHSENPFMIGNNNGTQGNFARNVDMK